MRKFIVQSIFFLAPILFSGILAEVLLRRIPNDYAYKRNYLDDNSWSLKVLVLGNSHDYYGIDPQYISLKCFNAAYVSQSLDFDKKILEKYQDRLDSLQFIVLGIDYFTMYSKLEGGIENWRVKNYHIYYGINHAIDLFTATEIFGSTFFSNAYRLYSFYLKGKSPVTCTGLGNGIPSLSKLGGDLSRSGQIAAERHTASSEKFLGENIVNLEMILTLASAKGISVLMITSPAHASYIDGLDDRQLTSTIQIAKYFAATYKNVEYFNFLNDSTFRDEDFLDADHLNDQGARKLSGKIETLIQSSPGQN